MSDILCCRAKFRSIIYVASLTFIGGCSDGSMTDALLDEAASAGSVGQSDACSQGKQDSPTVIVSDGPITVRDGQVTYGRPAVTEDVEKEICRALSDQRDLARSIEGKVPGGNRGSRQCRETYALLEKGYMTRYGLSKGDINAILSKGDQHGWE